MFSYIDIVALVVDPIRAWRDLKEAQRKQTLVYNPKYIQLSLIDELKGLLFRNKDHARIYWGQRAKITESGFYRTAIILNIDYHDTRYKIQRDSTGLKGAVLGGVYRQHVLNGSLSIQ